LNSPNANIPQAQQNPPIIVCRGTTPEQLEVDLNRAVAAGYLPEPGLMSARNNEVWVVCYYRPEEYGLDVPGQPEAPRAAEPEPAADPEPYHPLRNPGPPDAKNVNEDLVGGGR